MIEGPPRTKKNHTRIVKAGDRLRLIQSEAAMRWADNARLQLRQQYKLAPINVPVNLTALVYRDIDGAGDLINYLQAICDVLQATHSYVGKRRIMTWPGVITNDALVRGFDGSRLMVDREHPRVDLILAPLA